jgi:hypothetical protein
MLRDLCRAGVDCVSTNDSVEKRMGYKEIVVSLLAFIVAMFLIAFIGKWVWNATMPQLFTFARPVNSCWEIIGLLILVSLFR